MEKIKHFILYLWQLPQNLLGFLVVKITRAELNYAHRVNFYYISRRLNKNWSGVSLGNYIILSGGRLVESPAILLHERGHQIQSKYLGWLYLILIGLPSLIGNITNRFIKFNYYAQPWEAWADHLGGVKREK